MDSSNVQENHDVVQRFFARGGSVRMLGEIEQADLNTLYAHANQLFNAGEVEAARNFYTLLSRLDHWNFDYWFALGLSYQRLSDHEAAIYCFSRSGMIRIDDPRSSYFAGVSYRAVDNEAYAAKSFKAAIAWCGDQPVYAGMRLNAEQLMAQRGVKK